MDILNDIDNLLIVFEYSNKIKDVMTLINSPRNPVLRIISYKYWENYLTFVKLFLYHTLK